MKQTAIIVVGLVVLGLVGYGITVVWNRSITPSSNTRSTRALEASPDFSLQDYEGNTIRRSQFLGKALVLNCWASWCPFCVEELPDFARVQEEFGGQAVVIAINRAESQVTAKKFSDQVGVTGRLTLLLDPADSFYRSIGGFSMPETIFVDKDGFIRHHKRGPMDVSEIRGRVTRLLEGVDSSLPSVQ